MSSKPHSILFLCTGNSARSILAEAIANRLGEGRLRGYSAGSRPQGRVHPAAVALLRRRGYSTDALRSKSWDEFAGCDAPALDVVITVCDNAAAESCPVWAGRALKAHWGMADPAVVAGTPAQTEQAFEKTYALLHERISSLVELLAHAADEAQLRQRLQEIAEGQGPVGEEC